MSKPENSEPENFLTRWSARKLANRTQSGTLAAEQRPADTNSTVETAPPAKARKESEPDEPFDPARLPPLDSIGPDTSIADFLGREVPPDLTRAALRRAWTSDPAIKDFVGLVENGWDFNDPSGMSGFGPISAEEVARLAGTIINALPEAPPANPEELAGDQKSRLASTKTEPTPTEVEPLIEEGRAVADDAAQQNETGNKS